jgi:hypothetical protein
MSGRKAIIAGTCFLLFAMAAKPILAVIEERASAARRLAAQG